MPRSTQAGSTSSSWRRKVRGVAAAALAGLVQDVHGQLGEPVAGEHVDRPALDHVAGRPKRSPKKPLQLATREWFADPRPGGRSRRLQLTRADRRRRPAGRERTRPRAPAGAVARAACAPSSSPRAQRGRPPRPRRRPPRPSTLVTAPGSGARHSPATPPCSVRRPRRANARRLALGPVHERSMGWQRHAVPPSQPVWAHMIDHLPLVVAVPATATRRRHVARPARPGPTPAPRWSRPRRAARRRAGRGRRCASRPRAPARDCARPAPPGG